MLNNFLNGVTLAATAEVMVAGKKAGLDLAQLLEVINTSSGVSFASLNRHLGRGTGGLTSMHISHGRSGQPSEQRTATFTGTVQMDPVLNAPGVMINTVIFPPGARTYWHRHPGGQLLVVTAGRGVVATRDQVQAISSGDVIWAEPGEEHWHGACDDSLMTHLAVSHGTTEWAGEVEADDYTAAQ